MLAHVVALVAEAGRDRVDVQVARRVVTTLLSVCETGSQRVSVSPSVWAIRITPGADAFSTPNLSTEDRIWRKFESVPIVPVSAVSVRLTPTTFGLVVGGWAPSGGGFGVPTGAS